MDIFCKNKRCPICETKMVARLSEPLSENRQYYSLFCKNNCFIFAQNVSKNGHEIEMFVIFDEQSFQLPMFLNKEEKEEYYKKVEAEVNYWKQDEKYVMRIIAK